MIDPKELSQDNFEQLALGLEIDEVEDDGVLSEAEVKRRSEMSLFALKDRLKADDDAIANANKSNRTIPRTAITWSTDFYFLLDAGWPWRVAAYIAWACCPRRDRNPKTQEDLATQHLGLTSDRQISTWRKKNPSIDEAIGLMQAAPLMERRRDVFEALAESAADPSFHGAQDRKTFLTITQDYIPHQKVDIEATKVDPVEMTEEELAEIERKRSKND